MLVAIHAMLKTVFVRVPPSPAAVQGPGKAWSG